MPEVAEPPPQVAEQYVPPQVPEAYKEPLKVKAGDKFRAEFEKLTHPKSEEAGVEVTKPDQGRVQPEKVDAAPAPEVKPETPTDKPTSPLDVVTADKKPEVKEPDVLDEFNDKNPDWKRAREVIKTQRQEKKALETAIAELKKAPKADPEQITKLSQERDTLKQSLTEREDLIKSVDIKLSDEYRGIAKKRDDTVQKIGDRAKSYGVDPAALISALALPEGRYKNEQIDALLTEVAPSYRAKIDILVDRLEEQNETLFEFEKDAPKKYEEIQAKRDATLREQQEASVKMIESEFGKIMDELPKDVLTARIVDDDVPGGTDWNGDIHKATENALRILKPGGSDFKESSVVAWKGSHYDSLLTRYLALHERDRENTKRLAEYDAGGPDFRGSQKPKGETKLTPSQKYHKSLEQIQGSPTE